jgi:SAM-dependent methyltransferase
VRWLSNVPLTMSLRDRFTREFWDERYGHTGRLWSGRPNAQLVAEVSGLTPGTALDVGCGEGGDAIWLAQQGWTVTGADVSPVGLERAAANARDAAPDLAEHITWYQADLFADEAEPFGTYDLVNSQYLHLLPELRERSIHRLGAAVAPGGTLLLVSHHPADLEIPGLRPHVPELFYTPDELAAHLDPTEWEIVTAAGRARQAKHHGDGSTVTVHDTVLSARRTARP